MIDPRQDGFCPNSQDQQSGGHSPEWIHGDPCRWCGHERQLSVPDIEVTSDLEMFPWASHRGGSFRQGDIRRVGLFRHEQRGRLVALMARLTDGSDAVVYATVMSAMATLELLRQAPIVMEEQEVQRKQGPSRQVRVHIGLLYSVALALAIVLVITLWGGK